MKSYAIRHKPTGLFIPRLATGKRNGGSYSEPSDIREPRLFHNALAARSFLSNWLQGTYEQSYAVDSYGNECPGMKVTKQPHRKKEDMEIVEFNLLEVAN